MRFPQAQYTVKVLRQQIVELQVSGYDEEEAIDNAMEGEGRVVRELSCDIEIIDIDKDDLPYETR